MAGSRRRRRCRTTRRRWRRSRSVAAGGAGRDARGASVSEQAALRRRLPPRSAPRCGTRLAGDPVEVAGEIVLVCEQAALAGVPGSGRVGARRRVPGRAGRGAGGAVVGAVRRQLDDRRCNDWLGRAPALLAWLPAGVPDSGSRRCRAGEPDRRRSRLGAAAAHHAARPAAAHRAALRRALEALPRPRWLIFSVPLFPYRFPPCFPPLDRPDMTDTAAALLLPLSPPRPCCAAMPSSSTPRNSTRWPAPTAVRAPRTGACRRRRS